jgi:bacterioferritin
MASKEEIIQSLQKAYWRELETVMNYIANSENLDGLQAAEIKESLEQEVTDEIGHAQQLAARIKELGGAVPCSYHFQAGQASLQTPEDTTNVQAIVQGVIDAENEAINGYKQIAQMAEGEDFVTHDLAVRLMGDEEKHLSEFKGYLKGLR